MTIKYVCPRCNYSSTRKTDVSRHFHRKIRCPPLKSDITLSPEIIEHILNNRQDALPIILQRSESGSEKHGTDVSCVESATVQINNTQNIVNINHNNNHSHNHNRRININKLVIQIDSIDKIKEIVKHQDLVLSGVDITFENIFQEDCQKWVEGKSDYLGLNKFDLLDYVNRGLEAQSPAEFNIVYKTNPNRICIYNDGQWENYLEERGVHRVVELLRSYAFDEYELYLLKKIHTALCNRKIDLTICLETYYNFLICFDMSLHAEGQTDQYIMGYTLRDDSTNSIENYAIKLYSGIKKSVEKTEKKRRYREVLDIIKGSSANNMNRVNTAMMNILSVDQEFREQMINKASTWTISNENPALAITSEL